MSTIREEIQSNINSYAECLSTIASMRLAVEQLGLADLEAYVYISIYSEPRIDISPLHTPGIVFMEDGGPNMRVTDTTPIMSQLARHLLPKVGKLEKGFDADNNQVTLTTTYNGIIIVLKDQTPSTCTVERVEETVDVPEKVIPAHQEKKVRYVLKGDCDPILADAAAHIETSQGAVAIEPEVPF